MAHLYQGIADGGVAVGVELHGMSYDVGHLVVASVIHALHGVQNAALHRLQTVLDVGNGTFQNDIRCIVQKPVLIHAAQMMYCSSIETVYRLIVRMGLCSVRGGELLCTLLFYFVLYFVVHGLIILNNVAKIRNIYQIPIANYHFFATFAAIISKLLNILWHKKTFLRKL